MALLANDIYIGSVANPLYHFDNSTIVSGTDNGVFSVDPVGNELTVDTFSFTVFHEPNGDPIYGRLLPIDADGLLDVFGDLLVTQTGYSGQSYLADVAFGTPVIWNVEGEFFSKGYAKTVVRVGRTMWKVSCVSGVGLLDEKYHVGGIYRGATLQSVVQSIIGNSFSYSFDAGSGVAGATITGHLPYDTARNNLHRVLFSVGASMLRGGENNEYIISYLNDTTRVITDRRVTLGGDVVTELPSNVVEITEHYYAALPSDMTLTLYDNTTELVTADHALVVFQDPMHSLSASGLTINESGANYAIVSGVGTLTGKRYTHIEHLITLDESNGTAKRVKSVKDNHVISEANSLNVARRVLDFYKNSRNVRAKFIADGEKTGEFIQMSDPFGEPIRAFLKRANVTISSLIGANCELVEGFTPGPYGDYFNSYLIVKGSDLVNGNWQVPAAIQGKRARIVLFSGAQGGQGGWYGKGGDELRGGGFVEVAESWNDDTFYEYGLPGEIQQGFAGGEGGNGGASATRILSLDIASLAASYPVTLGAGGEGGAGGTAVRDNVWLAQITYTPPQDGQPGANSVFNGASTANGSEFGGTYYNIVTGEALAQVGVKGQSGAKGGNGGASLAYRTYNTRAEAMADDYGTAGKGQNGSSFGSYSGGAGVNGEGTRGNTLILDNTNGNYTGLERKVYRFALAGGAGGGGAAAGGNGSSGQTGSPASISYYVTAWGERYDYTYYGVGKETDYKDGDEYDPDYHLTAFGGNGGNATAVPTQAIYRGGTGGYGGGGGGGAPQGIGYHYVTLSSGRLETLGANYGGKGGNGGKGGKGSDGFFIVYYQA